MRTSIAAIVGSILMVNVCAADERQYFIDALQRTRASISDAETYIIDHTSTRNFPADLALGTTTDPYRNIEALETQIDIMLLHGADLKPYLNVLHVRIVYSHCHS